MRSRLTRPGAAVWSPHVVMVIGHAPLRLLAAIAACCGCATDRPGADDASLATVTAIVDGDTIDVEIRGRAERVRLTGIDTPEISHPAGPDRRATSGECFGPEASDFTATLVPVGTAVTIERDIVGRDDYGRLLGYIHRLDDGIFVNYEIVRHGYAQPLSIAPNDTYAELIVQAARLAEADHIGLWAACAN